MPKDTKSECLLASLSFSSLFRLADYKLSSTFPPCRGRQAPRQEGQGRAQAVRHSWPPSRHRMLLINFSFLLCSGLSSYMLFSQAMRETVKAENPDVSFGTIGKILGQKWKELSEEDKAPYNQAAVKYVPFTSYRPRPSIANALPILFFSSPGTRSATRARRPSTRSRTRPRPRVVRPRLLPPRRPQRTTRRATRRLGSILSPLSATSLFVPFDKFWPSGPCVALSAVPPSLCPHSISLSRPLGTLALTLSPFFGRGDRRAHPVLCSPCTPTAAARTPPACARDVYASPHCVIQRPVIDVCMRASRMDLTREVALGLASSAWAAGGDCGRSPPPTTISSDLPSTATRHLRSQSGCLGPARPALRLFSDVSRSLSGAFERALLNDQARAGRPAPARLTNAPITDAERDPSIAAGVPTG